MRTLLIHILLCLIASPVGAQIQPQQINEALRRAAVFEGQNDLNNAQKIYRALYDQYPNRADFLLRLERVLSRTGQHEEAAHLLRKRLAVAPDDTFSRLRLGDALFAQGKRDSAFAQWEIIANKANDHGTFAQVINRYRQHNLDNRAAALYKRARQVLNQPELFAREMAQLAERQTHYAEAVREYLIFVDQQPQYRSLVEARLRDLAQNGEQHEAIFALLAEELRQHPKDRLRLSFMIEFALPAGFADRALQLLLHTAEQPTNNWAYFSRIAQYALDARDATTATAAYQALYDRVDRPDLRARAQLGLARAAEIAPNVQAARIHYQTLIHDHKNRPEADEAQYRLGIIQRDIDGDPQSAQQTFRELVDTHRRSPWRYRALVELAEGYLQADQPDAAERALIRIVAERPNEPEATEAQYKLAELKFLSGAPDAAQTMLQALLGANRNRDVINDAIALSSLIQEGLHTDPELLQTYASIERKRRQHKLEDALQAYTALSDAHPESFLADRLLHRQAEILETLNRLPEAIQTHRKLIATAPWSPFCPTAQMALARIYDDRLKQYYDAQKAYEALLTNYPLSLEADLARERLRLLKQKIETMESQKEAG